MEDTTVACDDTRRSVLLLKAADGKYTDALRSVEQSHGGVRFDVHFADVLTFEYVNANKLREVLLQLDTYSSLLVTSPRAGTAIRNVVEAMESETRDQVIASLTRITVFSVGKATTQELECFGVDAKGDHCGSADVMAEYIHQTEVLASDAAVRPALFLCGDKRRDTLPDSFRERQLPITELNVYRTCAVEDFCLPDGCEKPDWVVYFSPSGIKATRRVSIAWDAVKKAAIGKTTATALEKVAQETNDSSWVATVVAETPTAEGVARAIANFELAHRKDRV